MMDGAKRTTSVLVDRVIGASVEQVWTAWIDPEHIMRWWGRASGARMLVAAMDVRPGGRFRFQVRALSDGVESRRNGVYLEVDPFRRLAFTWIDEEEGTAPSWATVTFVALTADTTQVEVSHDHETGEAAALHAAVWHCTLDDLAGHFLPVHSE